MGRFDYPFKKSDFKIGSNLAISIIIIVLIAGAYVFKVIVWGLYALINIISAKPVSHRYSFDKVSKKSKFVIAALVIIGCLGVFLGKYYSYPISAKLYKMDYIKREWVLNNLRKHRTENKNPIFWDTPSITYGVAENDSWQTNYSIETITFNGILYNAEVLCSDSNRTIHVRIPYSRTLEKNLLSYYGKRHIHNREKGKDYYNVWLLESCYVVVEKLTNNTGNEFIYLEIGEYHKLEDGAKSGAYINTFEDYD